MSDIPWWDPFDVTDKDNNVVDDSVEVDPCPWTQVRLGGHYLPGSCTVTGAATHQIDVQKASGRDGGTLIERGYSPSKFDIDMKIWSRSHWTIWRQIRPQLLRRPGKENVGDASASKKLASVLSVAKKTASAAVVEVKRLEKAAADAAAKPEAQAGDPRAVAVAFDYEQKTKAAQKDLDHAKAAVSAAEHGAREHSAMPVENALLQDAGISSCVIESIAFPRPGPEWGTWVIAIKCIEYVTPSRENATRKAVGHRPQVPVAPALDAAPARNKPVKPSDAGDGEPNGPPKFEVPFR
jgi:hypothetical protein